MSNVIKNQLFKNLPNAIWQRIGEIDELKGRWIGGAKLNPRV